MRLKLVVCFGAFLVLVALSAQAVTLDSLKVTFGRNEGKTAFDRIIREQGSDIQNLVNRQLHDPALFISVESNADGVRYATDHLKKNVVMAEERNVTGANLLEHFGADMGRVYAVALNKESDTGTVQRYVLLRLLTVGPPEPKFLGVPILAPSAPEKPVIERTTTVYNTQFLSQVWVGTGLAYTPAKRLVPMVQGEWGNERLRFVCEAAYSLYHQHRMYADEKLDVAYRYVLVGVDWRPLLYGQFGVIAGWQRSEEYALDYGKYARKLEGPAIGLRLEMSEHIALTGLWTPCEVNTRGQDKVERDDGRFSISLSVFTSVLGGNEE